MWISNTISYFTENELHCIISVLRLSSTLGHFILASVNFSEFHKNKFSTYFILKN